MEQHQNDQTPNEVRIDLSEIQTFAADMLADWGEVTLDSFLANGPIKDIPVLGTARNIIRIGKSIREAFFIQKLTKFVRGGTSIDPVNRRRFRDRLAKDRGFAKRTATHLVIVLDRLDELEKAALLARIFAAYIDGSISQQQMRRLTTVLDRTLLDDLTALKKFVRENDPLDLENFYGLEGVGLASVYHSITRPLGPEDVHGQIGDIHFIVGPTAVLLIKIAF